MAVYPGSPYGFGGMPYRPSYPPSSGMPTGQVQYTSSTQYTITQPINAGYNGMMPGGQMPPMGGMPSAMYGMPQQPMGGVTSLYGMPQQQFGMGGQPFMPQQNVAFLQPQPQVGFVGQPGIMQPNVLIGGGQFPGGGQALNLGGGQFGGGMQGFSSGNNVPSIQQLGAQAFGQWPVGVFSPQARLS